MSIKKTSFIFLLISIFCNTAFGQIVITNADMPNIKEIYVLKMGNSLNSSFNYDATGTDFIWDISSLSLTNLRNDTFVSVTSTPLIYNLFFNNPLDPERLATIAVARQMDVPAPGLTVSDVYFFMKESSDKFSELGFGATINGTPTPIKYDYPDVLYKFPISFGSTDSSMTSFSLNIPSYGYFGQTKKRINSVDGWGTLIMPQGQFPVMRIKSNVFYEDTLFYAQYNYGIKINREETEYRWLGSEIGVPLLFITESANGISIEAYDSMFINTANIVNVSDENNVIFYPNPLSESLYLNYTLAQDDNITYSIYDIYGKRVYSESKGKILKGPIMDKIEISQTGIKPGVYILYIEMGLNIFSLKFIVE